MNSTSKRILAIGLPLCLVVATGAAIAFWTGSGSGTGTASTSAGVTTLTVSQTSIGGLAPGRPATTISGSVGNPSAESVYVTAVTASITGVAPAGAGTCDATDYTLLGATMAVNAQVAGNGTVPFTGATIGFNNKATNQDGCKGATVTLSYLVS